VNPFAWITRKVLDAGREGFRQLFAEFNPEKPPATFEEFRAAIGAATPTPALPAAEKTPEPTEEPEAPSTKKRSSSR